ncbi:hypothetical protein CXB51_022430 [Gossypium anomalum]|uniref:Tyrosine-specific transport protein n=1 Tax=Gossypium anomalum TaxID=47600 RepID=A0A8J6CV93_9ROSI|nr:hypothetical protein CXB51_022430 [Gossypium anomalum]
MSISMTIPLQTPTSLISRARPRLLLHTHNLLCPKSLLRNRLHHHSHHQLPTPFKTFKCSSQRQSSDNQPQEYEFERLFSNLNQATLKREPGSLSSAIFLVAGTTVGAGILAIPAVTQDSGFLASAVACILCWVFMVATGLLIAEVNVNTMCELGSGGVSLLVIHIYTLCPSCCLSGSFFRYFDKLSWPSLVLMTAFDLQMGECNIVLFGLWWHLLLWKNEQIKINLDLCFNCSQRFVGAVNGVLVFGIIASFTALVAVASGGLEWDALLKANFEAVPMSIPIIALSFVYQNVVPVLCTNLEGNMSKVRTAIVVGTAIPLGLFLVWDAVILGSISSLGTGSDQMVDPLQQLRASNSGVVGPIIEVFSLLAIATSYIGFVLGLSDFLADLLKLPAGENRPQPYLLTLIPPLGLALLDPEIFFKALDFAGTYGVLVLFGILPAAMSWSDRYSTPSTSVKLPELVPGGRLTLTLVMLCSGGVIVTEILESLGHP